MDSQEKTPAKEGDDQKQPKRLNSDTKPRFRSDVDSFSSARSSFNTSDDDYNSRDQGWNIPPYEQYRGEWDMGEQEIPGPCKSETEETPSTESKEKSEEQSATSSDAISNVYAKLSPFSIRWSFGVNHNAGLINLTTAKNFEVYYVSSHFGVIYNYRANTMLLLPGHNYPITSIAADASGRWLVSADAGEDTVIIVWDSRKKIPAWSLYNVFPEGVQYAAISPDARFLVAISTTHPTQLKFWLWTYGRDEPDGTLDIDPSYGSAKRVNFNHLNTDEFAVTTDFHVVFCEWKRETKELVTSSPTMDPRSKKLGNFRETIFLDDKISALTSTSKGYVILWTEEEDVFGKKSDATQNPGVMSRQFFKAVMLHKEGITSLKLSEEVIVSSSEDGTILFHDQQLRLLYWPMNLKADAVADLSFNIGYIPLDSDPFSQLFQSQQQDSANEEVENIFEYDAQQIQPHEQAKSTSKVTLGRSASSITHGKINVSEPVNPTDCTLNSRSFRSRDFMFLTKTGKLGYVSHKRRKVKYYLYATAAPLLSVDCDPNKVHIVVGDTQGRLALYDYMQKKLLFSTYFSSAITTLKYSRLGHCLLAGFQNGDLLELDPLLLTVNFKFEVAKNKIEKISFAHHDDIFAFYDQSSTVNVFMRKGINKQWVSMGTYISHYKPIVDILFEEQPEDPKTPRLFTIGQDRMLVEYDMKNLEENKLKILSMTRIEQTAVPWCITWLYDFFKTPHFLISNDQYKLKVYDSKNHICQKTTLGPTADTPIKLMKVIPDDKSPRVVYVTDKHIGLRLLPPTGNPFEGMGMIAHPQKVIAFAISHDHRFVFTAGVDDLNLLVWEINPGCLEVASQMGGNGLDPYVSLIEGGTSSFLFKEIEDFFYYAQILHQGEDPNLDRSVSRSLALCEIPDMFRALGFYMTEYEVENLLHELKHIDYETTGEYRTEITFEECVKAFLNHRPVHGISIEDINNALYAIADLSDPTDVIVERSELYKALEEGPESMNHEEAVGYLCILLLPKDENNPFPPSVSLNEFTENVLGIDLTITEENVREITHGFESKT